MKETNAMDMHRTYSTLEDVVRQTFATVVWSHKIQEKQCDIEIKKYHIIEAINIFFASLTSAGVIGLAFKGTFIIKLLTALVSFVTVFCSTYLRCFHTQDIIFKHKVTAQKLVAIRNKLVSLIADIHLECGGYDELKHTYDLLLNELHVVYADAPSTTKEAVQQAKVALVENQDYTFSDEEIDRFLPAQLRKGGM